MRRLGRPDADDGTCSLMFDEQGRRAFAAAHRAPDCAAAMRAARERITDPTRYRDRIDLVSLTVRAAGPLAEVDACRVRWRENALGELLTGTTAGVLPTPLRTGTWTGSELRRVEGSPRTVLRIVETDPPPMPAEPRPVHGERLAE